ncbi:hypothetical protein BGZ57DRAFT_857858 [Hyaloscypha finlandica]|nr:hypothetical protein BGZ57DRAFT_857858 [Hyaloscypha finlandica]
MTAESGSPSLHLTKLPWSAPRNQREVIPVSEPTLHTNPLNISLVLHCGEVLVLPGRPNLHPRDFIQIPTATTKVTPTIRCATDYSAEEAPRGHSLKHGSILDASEQNDISSFVGSRVEIIGEQVYDGFVSLHVGFQLKEIPESDEKRRRRVEGVGPSSGDGKTSRCVQQSSLIDIHYTEPESNKIDRGLLPEIDLHSEWSPDRVSDVVTTSTPRRKLSQFQLFVRFGYEPALIRRLQSPMSGSGWI